MENIIKITTNEQGSKVVSARELHNFLEVQTQFTKWCERMFEYGFEEHKDYSEVIVKNDYNPNGGKSSLIDYALSIDTSKEIAMLQRTEKGKQARQYFIECEKKVSKPRSIEEVMIQQLQGMIEAKKQIEEVRHHQTLQDSKINLLEARTTTRPDVFTVAGYARLNRLEASLKICAKVGGQASRICKERGYIIDKCEDPRFGTVNMYPRSVLVEVFNSITI
jgi:phage anti-repressor protein